MFAKKKKRTPKSPDIKLYCCVLSPVLARSVYVYICIHRARVAGCCCPDEHRGVYTHTTRAFSGPHNNGRRGGGGCS